MTDTKRLHPAARMYAQEHLAGKMDRREFLTRTTALGVASTAAYALIGANAPARAAAHVEMGGTMRIQQDVRPLKDPRTWDWSQIANFARGWLEYLAEYQPDGTIRGMLLESWDANEDATVYTLNIRPGVKWNNGEDFTAQNVVHNIERWCEKSVEGNSMASRMGDMVDPDTDQIREGVIEVVDDLTVKLNLTAPDIAFIANVTDYPAAIVHESYDNGDFTAEGQAVGTGPFLPTSFDVGVKGVLERNTDHTWWGTDAEGWGGPYLDTVEFIDYGTDPSAWLAAFEAEEIDMTYESVGEFIEIMDAIGLVKSEATTANTICIRPNQQAEVNGMKPYEDVRVRRALQMAVDNGVLLELGYSGLGIPAANYHVAPLHPEYADVPPVPYDPAGALALMEEAGMADYEHELLSIDDDWRKNTTDAVAAQLRDAGIKVKRTILPGSTFWNDWAKYPFSSTNWNQRPLGVQVLALAYRSGEAWNESGYASEEFDSLLAEAMGIVDADKRRVVMEKIEKLMQDDGVSIIPFWQSVFRHHTENVVGAEMHPMYEIHVYRLGFAA